MGFAINIGFLLFVVTFLLIVGSSIYEWRSGRRRSGIIGSLQASDGRSRKNVDFSESPRFSEKDYIEFTTDMHGNVLPDSSWKDRWSFWVRVIISLLLLVCSLFVILSRKFSGDAEKWAFGTVGTILGYWLKV